VKRHDYKKLDTSLPVNPERSALKTTVTLVAALFATVIFNAAPAYADENISEEVEDTITWAYTRLVGDKPTPEVLIEIYNRLPKQNNGKTDVGAIIKEIMQMPDFYETRFVTLFSRMANEAGSRHLSLNDTQAILMLTAKSNQDFRRPFRLPFKVQSSDDGSDSKSRQAPGSYPPDVSLMLKTTEIVWGNIGPASGPATIEPIPNLGQYGHGILASYDFGRVNLENGTFRRPVRAVFNLFLCLEQPQLADSTLPITYMGGDVDPTNGGHTTDLRGNCGSCHSWSDAIRGAWFGWNATTDGNLPYGSDADPTQQVLFTKDYRKNLQNSKGNFLGTFDARWVNVFANSERHRRMFRFRGPYAYRGTGLLQLGTMITDTGRFSECMTMRIVDEFCDLPPNRRSSVIASPEFRKLADAFETGGYKFMSHIETVIRSEICSSN